MNWADILGSRQQPYSGLFTGRAVKTLSDFLVSGGGIEAVAEWRRHPQTVVLLNALKEVALQPGGVGLAPHEIAVQYGMTMGLQLAVAMLEDPTIVVSAPVANRSLPEPTYGTGESWGRLTAADAHADRP